MDWNKIKTEYITTDTSYRKLAKKYGVSFGCLKTKARNEKWVNLKEQNQHKTDTKTLEKISTMEADRLARMVDTFYSGIDKLLKIWDKKINEMQDADTKELRSMVQSGADLKSIILDKDMTSQNESMKKIDELMDTVREVCKEE